MDSNKLKWAKQASLEGLFNLQWIAPREDLLHNFLQSWEEIKDARIQGQVCGQGILINWVLIQEQHGISSEGANRRCQCNLSKNKNCLEKDCKSTCLIL